MTYDNSRFDHGQQVAQTSAYKQLQILRGNLNKLRRLRKGADYVKAVNDFWRILENGGKLTPNQMSYIDGMYEKMWGAAGFESYTVKHDYGKKRNGY